MVLTAHRCSPCADGGQVFGADFTPPPELQRFTVTSSKHMLASHVWLQPLLQVERTKKRKKEKGKKHVSVKRAKLTVLPEFHPIPTRGGGRGHDSITDVINGHLSGQVLLCSSRKSYRENIKRFAFTAEIDLSCQLFSFFSFFFKF